MGVGAAVVSADWVALASLWEAPTMSFLMIMVKLPWAVPSGWLVAYVM
jgi:hypothetical protein